MKLVLMLAIAILPLLILQAQQRPAQPRGSDGGQSASRPSEAVATGFLYKSVAVDGKTFAYCIWVPPTYNSERPWPVILFLHGSGERGEDGFLQTDVGIGRAIRRNPARFPAIVIMPQCRPDDVWWSEGMMTLAVRCVEKTSTEYHLDRDRIALTGLSLGGAGAYQLGARSASNFSAIVPVCGFWSQIQQPEDAETLKTAAQRLAKAPIRAFHGARDPMVPIERARELAQAIKGAGGDIEFKEFADGDHFIWDRVYEDADLIAWMLRQKRRGG